LKKEKAQRLEKQVSDRQVMIFNSTGDQQQLSKLKFLISFLSDTFLRQLDAIAAEEQKRDQDIENTHILKFLAVRF